MPEVADIRTAAVDAVREVAGVTVSDDDSIVSSGMIDSLSILTLIASIERKLGIRLKTTGLQPDDFDNIDLIVETVLRAKV